MKKTFIYLHLITVISLTSSAQNIGIGTNAPSEKLHINGNVKADSAKLNALRVTINAGDGKVLTSDASGNATWQSPNLNSSSVAGNVGFGVWGDCATNGNIGDYNPVGDTSGVQNDFFGRSVSISGNFAVVGADYADVNGNNQQGTSFVYQFIGNNWVQVQKLSDPAGQVGDIFGTSVSISGIYIIVGADHDDVGLNANQGSACIFKYDGSTWSYVQKLTDGFGAAGDFFGHSVSISGNYIIVGANGDDVNGSDDGSVTFFQRVGASWVYMQKMTDPTGAASDYFGESVSISGNYAIVGSSGDDVGANPNQGSATIFKLNGANWINMQKLLHPYGSMNDEMGHSVTICDNYALVGVTHDNVNGVAYQGAAIMYHYNGATWTMMQVIVDPKGLTSDYFGNSLSISGDYALIGSSGAHINGSVQGSALLFKRAGSHWWKIQTITDPAAEGGDYFGSAVALDGQRFVIGVPYVNLSAGKVVFGKVN